MTDHPLGLGMTGFLISGWLRECAPLEYRGKSGSLGECRPGFITF